MAHSLASRGSMNCWRAVVRDLTPILQQGRSFVTVQRGRPEKLELPPNLPEQFWSQLPNRLRPDQGKREIIIHKPPPSESAVCKDPVKLIDDQQLSLLDPTGARARLFHPDNKDGARVGDILLTTFKTGEPFSGVIMSIKSRGPATSVLLRNHLTRIGTEMDIKVFSPLVQSMEVAQKTIKRKRRARLYYLRKPEHDIGSVQKVVDQYLRQRALLTGGKSANQSSARRNAGKGRR